MLKIDISHVCISPFHLDKHILPLYRPGTVSIKAGLPVLDFTGLCCPAFWMVTFSSYQGFPLGIWRTSLRKHLSKVFNCKTMSKPDWYSYNLNVLHPCIALIKCVKYWRTIILCFVTANYHNGQTDMCKRSVRQFSNTPICCLPSWNSR